MAIEHHRPIGRTEPGETEGAAVRKPENPGAQVVASPMAGSVVVMPASTSAMWRT
jgi:hypothetical protein